MPSQFYETRIGLAQDAIRWHLARRLTDPTSAAYMRAAPAMPAIYNPAPVTLPPVPETWRNVQ